jgi:N-sulfoglucosamine sulfohydrolase
MYYPMRVVRYGRYKLIWNIAHPLPFPFASDLWNSATWQAARGGGPNSRYGKRTIDAYERRPRFELYDLETDPDEVHNLATAPTHLELRVKLQAKLAAFQRRTGDPWVLKWQRE